MVNVKIELRSQGVLPSDMCYLKYYICKHKKTHERFVYFLVSEGNSNRKLVIWLNAPNARGLGYDYYPTLIADYYDFQEIKDADLTFYV